VERIAASSRVRFIPGTKTPHVDYRV